MTTQREVKKIILIYLMKVSVGIFAIMLSLTNLTYGFDGDRKGFVLGGGLGIAPSIKWSGHGTFGAAQVVERLRENGAGPGLNFIIGHAWDERNMIVFEINGAIRSSEELAGKPDIAQWINGMVWYHYFGSQGKSLFTAVGIVLYRFAYWTSETLTQNIGPGLVVGTGYEFARHWQIAGYFGTGHDSRDSVDWNFSHFNLLLNFIAF